ncbi:MAG: WecB/TagA/CpsF family glycosyltransferase [Patescibacteria group bacterium]|nr:WecB/TagA/CpsF family glycosyltransferase [Patescibacteria group bacterium]
MNAKNSKSYKKIEAPVKNFILGVGVTNEKKQTILEYILNFIKKTSKNCYIVTPNPEIIVRANKDFSFKGILNNAEIALCDGVGVSIAGSILKKPFIERFTGVDMVSMLCEKASEKSITVGFLGGREAVAEKTSECLQKKYPGLVVSYTGEEWNNSKAKIDILFVAYGVPKQERWMAENLNKIPVRVMLGVGGTFDYISGKIPRAPYVIQRMGFEWLFRLFLQPWRIRRQLALLEFVFLVFKEKFKA